ncbi:ESPR-type extended signal peptide-containing protein [Psychrobacter sp. WY6]|uniref:ESPR domain-containing protein n=1 Tax=Psychrobacter sp. WY6 TaxID=2708350 RepID=UPI002022D342|nr:ESPR-type extended signal peptide-containing protein [Psychrobacter sp. WY6]
MNRIYKVIWNEALSCFTAVGEYAKGRGKSSKSSVSANATINTTSNLSSTQFFRLSTIAIGMLAAGFTMSPQAFAQVNVGGGTGSGTAILLVIQTVLKRMLKAAIRLPLAVKRTLGKTSIWSIEAIRHLLGRVVHKTTLVVPPLALGQKPVTSLLL